MTNLTNETVKELFHIAGQIARENYNYNRQNEMYIFSK